MKGDLIADIRRLQKKIQDEDIYPTPNNIQSWMIPITYLKKKGVKELKTIKKTHQRFYINYLLTK